MIERLGWVCGSRLWLRLELLNWTYYYWTGLLIGQLIGVLETVVVLDSIRLQLRVQCMLEIDGGYDASLGTAARTDGLSIKGNIEHCRQYVLKREVNPILCRITINDVRECRFARFD